jgi:hypothetical protein
MPILTPQDFTGKYKLHTGMYATPDIQAYIDKYVPRYLRELLGVDLYDSFVLDFDNVLNTPRSKNFKKIYFPLAEDIVLTQMIVSDGIKEMLKGFVYWEYSRDLMTTQTVYGEVQQKAENSSVVSSVNSLMWERYNEAIRTFNSIRNWIIIHWNDYPLGQVVSFGISVAGTGYTDGSKNLTPRNKAVTGLSITNAGTGYTTASNVGTTAITGTGTGLTVNVTEVGGIVTAVTIAVEGSGYNVGNLVTINGGTTSAQLMIVGVTGAVTGYDSVKATVTTEIIGSVKTSSLNFGGTAYTTNGNNIPLTGGTGTGATCNFVINTVSQVVQSFTIVNKGSGYTVGDTLTIATQSADALIVVNSVGDGKILTAIVDPVFTGNEYKIGDQFRVVVGGNNTAILIATYVGVGDFQLFNGREKLTSYWI